LPVLTISIFYSAPAFAAKDKPAGASAASVDRGLSGRAAVPYPSTIKTRNGLPMCNLDSFVSQAGPMADYIYGDESVAGDKPEFNDGFTAIHRINAGIVGVRDSGLTTGHGSYMPCAGGRDEFISRGGEWCYSGASDYMPSTANLSPGLAGIIGQVQGLIGSVGGNVRNPLSAGATAVVVGVGGVLVAGAANSQADMPLYQSGDGSVYGAGDVSSAGNLGQSSGFDW
ncbi:MAG: hypothetical protein JSS86_14185, partial [Cyanobacteria bacterium SZAS LIN-2]|nr:hypothetical protein [Cyanobacteria bacterium SZAS LIN-2]